MTTDLEQATPNPPAPGPDTVRLEATGGLERSRLTVAFRGFLAIPHVVWLGIWGLGAALLSIVNWVAVLVRGQTPDGLYRFYTQFINYAVHVNAYLYMAANSYPGFVGERGYEVDTAFDPHPKRQNRWTVAFRLILMVPVVILVAAIAGSGGPQATSRSGASSGSTTTWGFRITGLLVTGGVITWFYSLARARAPEGVQRMMLFALHFGAQAWSYIFLLTDRYPRPDPTVLGVPRRPPPHPIALRVPADELERSRLTVFFRFLLAIPHFVWLLLWAIAVFFVAILNWFAVVFTGRAPAGFHRFLTRWVRDQTHVYAFVTVVANPFPGFTGLPGSYPVDVDIAERERQGRLAAGFRLILLIPAAVISSALGACLYASALLGWWASLFTARMPRSLRNLGAWSLRYSAQLSAYGLLLTDRYPYAGPPADAESAPAAVEPEPAPEPAPEPEPAPPVDTQFR